MTETLKLHVLNHCCSCNVHKGRAISLGPHSVTFRSLTIMLGLIDLISGVESDAPSFPLLHAKSDRSCSAPQSGWFNRPYELDCCRPNRSQSIILCFRETVVKASITISPARRQDADWLSRNSRLQPRHSIICTRGPWTVWQVHCKHLMLTSSSY